MARKVGDLFVALGLHSEDYHKKLTKAQRAAQTESRKIQAEFNNIAKYSALAFTAAAAAATIAIKKTADFSESIENMSYKTGLSMTQLQEFSYIAKVTGTSLESLQRASKIVSDRMYEASYGSMEAKRTFRALNIEYKNADGTLRKVDDILSEASEKLSGMTDRTKMLALATQLFGRGAQDLLPALMSNRAGMAKLSKAAHNYGYIMTDEVILANSKFGDDLDTLKFAGEGMALMFGSKMIPLLQKYVDASLEWVKNNKELIGQKMDTVVSNIGDAFKIMSDHKDGILEIFKAAVAVAGVIGKSAEGWMLIAEAVSDISKNAKAPMSPPHAGSASLAAFGIYSAPSNTGKSAPRQLGTMTASEVMGTFGMPSPGGTTQAGAKAGGSLGIAGVGGYPWIGGVDSGDKATEMLRKSWSERLDIYQGYEQKAFDDESKYQDIRLGLIKEKWDYEQEIMNERMGMWASFGDNMASVLAQSVIDSGNAFENIRNGFERMLETMVAQLMAKAAVFGILNTLTKGGFGEFTGGFSKYVFGFRASGGPVSAGKSYVVGERGPELFTPNQSGRIVSNQNINDNSRLSITFSGADKSAMNSMSDIQLANRIKRVIRDYHLVGAY